MKSTKRIIAIVLVAAQCLPAYSPSPPAVKSKKHLPYGNRLIMLHEGRIIIDVSGEEKKNLSVEDLLTLFNKASGTVFANDRAILSE